MPNTLPPGMDMLDVPAGFDRERIDEVLKIKSQANDKFKEGDFFSAKCLYAGALEMLERCCLHLPEADQTWEGIKNNMALCDLKRSEWTRVVDATTEILTRNPSNTKALYRRGVARNGQGKLQEAQRDLKMVVEIDPENVDARQKLAEVTNQMKVKRSLEKDQADKMRGFLRGERLDDTVAISEDGGVRKMHGNENTPLFSSWIKRAWLSPDSGKTGAVTVHLVMKTQAGKEIFNTRKPPGALNPPPAGPHMVGQSKPAQHIARPARWVMDDNWGIVFKAWNAGVKSMAINELGRFEVAKHTLGPTVEGAIERCIERWMPDTPARREMYKGVPEHAQAASKRKQALQILCLPEEFCMELVMDPNTTLSMEMELLDVNEFTDIDGDGRHLMQVIREGKKQCLGVPVVRDLSRVTAHFRIAKLLLNYTIKDSRMGLASGADGMLMKEDKTKEPMELIVGEEDAMGEGQFVPPCIGRCLMIPPGGVVEGMHFELILRDGVPVSDMEYHFHKGCADGLFDTMPDTTGPVVVRIEVEKVEPPILGPTMPLWKGVKSILEERSRAEQLEILDECRHKKKALKRWRRIIVWLEKVLEGRRWKLQGGDAAGGDSMYDLEWEEEGQGDGGKEVPGVGTQEAHNVLQAQVQTQVLPALFEVESDLLGLLLPDELVEWATAHLHAAKLLEDSDKGLAERHARCAVRAAAVGELPKEVEIGARSVLAARLLATGERSEEALELLRVAQTLDPTSQRIKDQSALASQKDADRKTVDMKDALGVMKQDLHDGLESNDVPSLLMLLEEIDNLPLTWEAVNETTIGKEIGKCGKHEDAAVAERAKSVVAKLHRLAKEQRPLWVR